MRKSGERRGIGGERVNPLCFINIFHTAVTKLIYNSSSICVTRLARYVLLRQSLGEKFAKYVEEVDSVRGETESRLLTFNPSRIIDFYTVRQVRKFRYARPDEEVFPIAERVHLEYDLFGPFDRAKKKEEEMKSEDPPP